MANNTTVAGGYKVFGPTYNSTKYVRFGHEGTVNSLHNIASVAVPTQAELIDLSDEQQAKRQLAGKVAALNDNGEVVLAGVTYEVPDGDTSDTTTYPVETPVGLIVDDLGDIANGSNKVSFYFRGGEYYISVSRMGEGATELKPGDLLTFDTNGALIKTETFDQKVVAVVTTPAGLYTTGNMYENAGKAANGGDFVGIELRI